MPATPAPRLVRPEPNDPAPRPRAAWTSASARPVGRLSMRRASRVCGAGEFALRARHSRPESANCRPALHQGRTSAAGDPGATAGKRRGRRAGTCPPDLRECREWHQQARTFARRPVERAGASAGAMREKRRHRGPMLTGAPRDREHSSACRAPRAPGGTSLAPPPRSCLQPQPFHPQSPAEPSPPRASRHRRAAAARAVRRAHASAPGGLPGAADERSPPLRAAAYVRASVRSTRGAAPATRGSDAAASCRYPRCRLS